MVASTVTYTVDSSNYHSNFIYPDSALFTTVAVTVAATFTSRGPARWGGPRRTTVVAAAVAATGGTTAGGTTAFASAATAIRTTAARETADICSTQDVYFCICPSGSYADRKASGQNIC